MSEAASSDSPFQESQKPEVSQRVRVRPGGLTIICVLAIVLGVFTLLGALYTIATLAFMEQIQQFATSFEQSDASDEVTEMNREMRAKLTNVNLKYRLPMMALNLSYLVLSVLLLLGGGKGLAMQKAALPVLTIACIAGIVLEIADGGVAGLSMSASIGVLDSMLAGADDTGSAAAILLLTRWSLIMSAVMVGATTLAKLLYYGLSWRYLRRDPVRTLFEDSHLKHA
jgi:hypothetical protein